MKTIKFLFMFILPHILYLQAIKAQTWEWAKGVNDSDGLSTTYANSIVFDSAGYIYSMVGFKQSASFSSCGLAAVPYHDSDFALVKYNSGGDCIWAKPGGGYSNDYSKIIGLSKNNNTIYTAGQFGSGGGNIDGINFSEGIFIAKYDLNGNCYWGMTIITGGFLSSATIDNNGNILISGLFNQPIQVDTVAVNPQVIGEYESYIAKFNQYGKVIWIKQININTGISTISMPDLSGAFYCTCLFYDTLVIDAISLISQGSSDAFIAKFDTGGAVKWVKQIGGPGGESDVKLSIVNNTIYSVVRINNGFTSDCDSGSGTGVFLSKLDTAGNCIWSKTFPYFPVRAITVDSLENIFIVGGTGGINFSGCNITNQWFGVILLDSNGVCQNIGATNAGVSSCDIGIDRNNNIYLAGMSVLPLVSVFGNDTIYAVGNPGYSTGFIAKLSGLITDTPPAKMQRKGLFIFPNPAQQKYTLIIPEDLSLEGMFIRVFDSTGRLAMEEPAYSHQQTLDMWGYPKGIYLVRVNVGTVDYVGNIVVE